MQQINMRGLSKYPSICESIRSDPQACEAAARPSPAKLQLSTPMLLRSPPEPAQEPADFEGRCTRNHNLWLLALLEPAGTRAEPAPSFQAPPPQNCKFPLPCFFRNPPEPAQEPADFEGRSRRNRNLCSPPGLQYILLIKDRAGAQDSTPPAEEARPLASRILKAWGVGIAS